ncbi:hypothetical protein [Haladaptatus sp. NG-WS-4]
MAEGETAELAITVVKRAGALRALRNRPLTRSELETELGVSRTTTH